MYRQLHPGLMKLGVKLVLVEPGKLPKVEVEWSTRWIWRISPSMTSQLHKAGQKGAPQQQTRGGTATSCNTSIRHRQGSAESREDTANQAWQVAMKSRIRRSLRSAPGRAIARPMYTSNSTTLMASLHQGMLAASMTRMPGLGLDAAAKVPS